MTNDSSYPTIKESLKEFGELWVKWNIGEIEGDEVLFQVHKNGYFLEAITKAWAENQGIDYQECIDAWLEVIHDSSPTTIKEDKE